MSWSSGSCFRKLTALDAVAECLFLLLHLSSLHSEGAEQKTCASCLCGGSLACTTQSTSHQHPWNMPTARTPSTTFAVSQQRSIAANSKILTESRPNRCRGELRRCVAKFTGSMYRPAVARTRGIERRSVCLRYMIGLWGCPLSLPIRV